MSTVVRRVRVCQVVQTRLKYVSAESSAGAVRRFSSEPSDKKTGDSPLAGRLNHVAVACPDLKKAAEFYRNTLGAEVSEVESLEEHGVYTVFVKLGNTKIELLHPLGENSPIKGFLQKNKNGGMHHICVEVADINAAMENVKKCGVRCLTDEAKIGAHGKPVVFLHPSDCGGVLIELEQC